MLNVTCIAIIISPAVPRPPLLFPPSFVFLPYYAGLTQHPVFHISLSYLNCSIEHVSRLYLIHFAAKFCPPFPVPSSIRAPPFPVPSSNRAPPTSLQYDCQVVLPDSPGATERYVVRPQPSLRLAPILAHVWYGLSIVHPVLTVHRISHRICS